MKVKLTLAELAKENVELSKPGLLKKGLNKDEITGYVAAMSFMNDKRIDALGALPMEFLLEVRKVNQ